MPDPRPTTGRAGFRAGAVDLPRLRSTMAKVAHGHENQCKCSAFLDRSRFLAREHFTFVDIYVACQRPPLGGFSVGFPISTGTHDYSNTFGRTNRIAAGRRQRKSSEMSLGLALGHGLLARQRTLDTPTELEHRCVGRLLRALSAAGNRSGSTCDRHNGGRIYAYTKQGGRAYGAPASRQYRSRTCSTVRVRQPAGIGG